MNNEQFKRQMSNDEEQTPKAELGTRNLKFAMKPFLVSEGYGIDFVPAGY